MRYMYLSFKSNFYLVLLLVTLGVNLNLPVQALAIDCVELDGAKVYSQEGTPVYLGFFGTDTASDSIMNEVGTYGSTVSSLSVRNAVSKYGSSVGTYSANDDVASKPPRVYKNGLLVTYLTTNQIYLDRVSLSEIDSNCTNRFIASSPSPNSQPPSAPASINASDGLYTDKIQVTWSVVTGATLYKVYYSDALSGTKSFIGSTTSTSLTFSNITAGQTYYFWVSASNNSGDSNLSNPDSGYMAIQQTIQYALSVEKSGDGSGIIISAPVGINCGLDCNESYANNTTVILTATASSGSMFIGWSGNCGEKTASTNILVNENKTCFATFQKNSSGSKFLPAILLLLK